ncbi:phosphatidylglycerol lysyltransferase domain-containing protein [Demequina sp. NBRC 110057]|uniref:phosphatidylglycerol lysyltransferase domain-containing protein n=1 Tax=Demequina sp. NBRC 110057 TaxID=1570346 RepID=UPI00190E7740|nr:phosphatidylglycerol lysyltransferase domain-containing protein [Demequina sp. NBRC 110057]
MREAPITLLIAAMVLIAGIATGALWTPAEDAGLVEQWGWGLTAFEEGHWWTLITGTLIAPTPWMYVLILALFVAGAGYLEHRFGWARMLIVTFGTHVASVLIVAAMFWVLGDAGLPWVDALSGVPDVGLSNAAFGAVGAVSAALPLLWRRRIRLIGVAYTLALVLWSAEIWDFTHCAAFLAGLAVGPWVVGRRFERPTLVWGAQEVRDAAAVILTVSALQTILVHVWPGEGGILAFGHPEVPTTTMVGDLGIAVINLTFAYAIHLGSRLAWRWITTVSIITAVGGVVVVFIDPTPTLILSVALDLILVALLVGGRRFFTVRRAERTMARAWRRVAVAGVATLVFTTSAILAMSGSFSHEPTVAEAIGTSVVRLFGGTVQDLEPTTTGARVLLSAIGMLWWAVIAVSIISVLVTTRRFTTHPEARSAFEALQSDGTGMTSIGYMARWAGIDQWISSDGGAGWAFRLVGNTVIVLSDPVGADSAVKASIREFEDYCRARGWRVACFAITPRMRDLLEGAGWRSIQVAEDTVIDLPELEFKGKAWQDVRSALNRAKRDGISMRSIHLHEAPRGLRDQLEHIEAQWAGDKSLPEMGFTLGTLREADDPHVRMHVAVDEDGTVHGMTSWLPVYREGDVVGWTIDIMKRRLDDGVMSGVMEFLIAQTALEFKEAGYAFISLSCAPLANSGEPEGPLEVLLDRLAQAAEPFYGFSSLERFKAKFKPRHVPMHLAYRDEGQLPTIALALGRAYLPDATTTDLIKAAVARE